MEQDLTEDIKKSIAKFWDENTCDFNKAQNFDELDKKMFKTYPYAEKMLKMDSSGGLDIIEIGVGSACSPCKIINKHRPRSYTLYDISPKTLEIASNHLKEHCSDFEFNAILGDMEDMSVIPDKSFDRVIAVGCIHHTSNPSLAMKEISRILRDDGDFVFMFYNKDSWEYKYILPRIIKRKRNAVSVDDAVRQFDGAGNPIGIALSKNEVKSMCNEVGLQVSHMETRELRYVKRLLSILPRQLKNFLIRRHGVSLYVYGGKL